MDRVIDSIGQLLWFLHRTIFEIIPAFLVNAVFYFYLKHVVYFKGLPLGLKELYTFFDSAKNDFFKGILIFGIIIFTHALMVTLANLFIMIYSGAAENLQFYPNYKMVKTRINEELKRVFGNEFEFDPEEIQNIVRYKIMEEHKEFNTFLWYTSTEQYLLRNFSVAIFIISIIILPLISLGETVFFEPFLVYFSLAILSGASYVFLIYLINSKVKQISLREKESFCLTSVGQQTGKMSLYKPGRTELIILFLAIAGAVLLNQYQAANTYIAAVMFVIGVNLLIFPVVYMLLIYSVVESRHFKQVLLDAYLNIRYNKQFFGANSNKKNRKANIKNIK